MENVKNERSRIWLAVFYPSDPTHVRAMEIIKQSMSFASILHDKDVEDDGNPKKAHYHFIIKFKQARWRNAVAEELYITPNYLQKCGNFDFSLEYLIHFNSPSKYQYEIDAVEGDLVPALKKLLSSDDENLRVLKLMQLIHEYNGYISFTELVEIACANGLYSDLRRMGVLATNIVREHNLPYC